MKKEEILEILDEALEYAREYIPLGEVATYIPELGKADPNELGICLHTKDGHKFSVGDTDVRFTIQSISKLITLAVALERLGREKVFSKVGMEPSGEAFNSLIDLDLGINKPKNPMINSGAITITSLILEHVTFEELLEFARELCMDPDMDINMDVYNSEMNNISRNKSIAYLLESKGIIETDVEKTLKLYTKMCSIEVTAESLANFGLILASDGVNPITEKRLLSTGVVHVLKTIMLMCGMYDASGEFAVKVGIPTKSGVAGGLISVVDKLMGIGIYSPPLDKKGNCIVGKPLLERLSRKFELHIFARHKI